MSDQPMQSRDPHIDPRVGDILRNPHLRRYYEVRQVGWNSVAVEWDGTVERMTLLQWRRAFAGMEVVRAV